MGIVEGAIALMMNLMPALLLGGVVFIVAALFIGLLVKLVRYFSGTGTRLPSRAYSG